MKIKNEMKNVFITFIVAIISAFTMHIIVVPADFAPSGVDGIATMLQYITGISMGVYSFALNLPLLIFAWFLLKKRYVIYTVVYTVISSVALVILENVNFYQLNIADEKLLAALVSGVILGIRSGIMLKIGASTGGAEIISAFVHKNRPYVNIETIISIICSITAFLSIFVYKNALSVLLAFVQMFVFDRAAEFILKDTRHAVEFKIITKNPEMLSQKIITELRHGATLIESRGVFSEEKNTIITTVVNIREIPELLSLIKDDPDAFVYYSEAKGVRGNFRWRKEDEVR